MANPQLTSITKQVEIVIVSLDQALSKLLEVESQTMETESAVVSSVEATKGSIDNLATATEDLSGLQSKTSETVQVLEEGLAQAREGAGQARSEISGLLDDISSTSVTALDDLKDFLEDKTDEFSVDLKAQIQLLELGIIRVDEINTEYLNAIVNGKTLRETLEGLDTVRFAQDIQSLAAEMRSSGADIGRILEFLTARGGELGKSIADWIRKARAGEITIERFREEIRKLLAALNSLGGDTSGLGNLLDGIEDLIQSDSATG